MKKNRSLILALTITGLFVINLVVAQMSKPVGSQSAKAEGGVGAGASNLGISVTNNTGADNYFDISWAATYCVKNSSCSCAIGPIKERHVFLRDGKTITRGFTDVRPSCEWAYQTDVDVYPDNGMDNEGIRLASNASSGCGNEVCPATCNSLNVSPNPFTVGQNVSFTCNVTNGAGASAVSGYAFNVQGVRYPGSGWQADNVLPLTPTGGGKVWCGAQTIGGTIVGGRDTSCTTNLVVRATAMPTPTPALARCNSLGISPNLFTVGQNVLLTCNVRSGTGQNAIAGYAFNVNGIRYPASGWQAGNTLSVWPTTGGSVWCGAQTVGGAIVGGQNTSCMTTLSVAATPTPIPTPIPTPVCIVGGRQASYGQTGAGFTITPLSQNLDSGTSWNKTWKISGKAETTANIEVVSYGCPGDKRQPSGFDLCMADRATIVNRHYPVVTIPASGWTTFTVTDEVDCCRIDQADLVKVNGRMWGSSFFLRWAEAPTCR